MFHTTTAVVSGIYIFLKFRANFSRENFFPNNYYFWIYFQKLCHTYSSLPAVRLIYYYYLFNKKWTSVQDLRSYNNNRCRKKDLVRVLAYPLVVHYHGVPWSKFPITSHLKLDSPSQRQKPAINTTINTYNLYAVR